MVGDPGPPGRSAGRPWSSLPCCLAPDLVDRDVMGDSGQPPADRAALRRQVLAVPPGPDERLLQDVFGKVVVI